LGIGDWGLGIGDWAQSPIPNPQSPIPNPQSPYFSFKNCQNLSKQILNYIIYIISNLTKLKILDLESNRLNNEQINILSNGLKEKKQ